MRADAGKRHTPFGRYAHKLTLTDVQYARALYRDGWSTTKIAARFGVTWQAIAYRLRRSGLKLRVRNRKPEHVERVGRWAGVTVTLREQQSGQLFTFALHGEPLDALRYIVKLIDSSDIDWRLLCYSTPQTILRDLRGDSRDVRPEVGALAKLDRLDLLDPAVRRHT